MPLCWGHKATSLFLLTLLMLLSSPSLAQEAVETAAVDMADAHQPGHQDATAVGAAVAHGTRDHLGLSLDKGAAPTPDPPHGAEAAHLPAVPAKAVIPNPPPPAAASPLVVAPEHAAVAAGAAAAPTPWAAPILTPPTGNSGGSVHNEAAVPATAGDHLPPEGVAHTAHEKVEGPHPPEEPLRLNAGHTTAVVAEDENKPPHAPAPELLPLAVETAAATHLTSGEAHVRTSTDQVGSGVALTPNAVAPIAPVEHAPAPPAAPPKERPAPLGDAPSAVAAPAQGLPVHTDQTKAVEAAGPATLHHAAPQPALAMVQHKGDGEAAAQKTAEEHQVREVEAKRQAEEKAKEAEENARKEAEEKEWAQKEAEQKAKKEAEEKAKKEAEEKAKKEAEEKAKQEAEEKAKREAEEKAKKEEEEKARQEAEAKAKQQAEERAKREAEARREAEEKARQEAEAKARQEAEEKALRDAAIAKEVETERDQQQQQPRADLHHDQDDATRERADGAPHRGEEVERVGGAQDVPKPAPGKAEEDKADDEDEGEGQDQVGRAKENPADTDAGASGRKRTSLLPDPETREKIRQELIKHRDGFLELGYVPVSLIIFINLVTFCYCLKCCFRMNRKRRVARQKRMGDIRTQQNDRFAALDRV